MKFTESHLLQYSAPLSDTEDQQCKNAIIMIQKALKNFGFTDDGSAINKMHEETFAYQLEMRNSYSNRKIKIFVQGSYANNINVRTYSDVDIAVVQEDIFYTKYRTGITDNNYNFSTASVSIRSFKDEVQEILKYQFGNYVERKNKSIKIHGNTYRKDADSVPCQRYRDYTNDYYNDATNYIGGIIIYPDSGDSLINYPEQNINNGQQKNKETKHQYKKILRIVKKIRYIMQDEGILSAYKVSSFGLESLVWNIPNEIFEKYASILKYSFDEIIKYLIAHKNDILSYEEANGIKPLFCSNSDSDNYIHFSNDL